MYQLFFNYSMVRHLSNVNITRSD